MNFDCHNCTVCSQNNGRELHCPYEVIEKFDLSKLSPSEHLSNFPRVYNEEQKRKVWHHDLIDKTYFDRNLGSEIKPEMNSPKAQRLIRNHRKFRHSGNEGTSFVYSVYLIKTVCSQLQLPNSVTRRAINLYRSKKLAGKTLENVALACVSIASEEQRIPVSYSELSEFGAEKKDISRQKREIIRDNDLDCVPLRAEECIAKILSELGKIEWKDEVLELIEDVEMGANPWAVVGGAIWNLSKNNGQEFERQEIAEACGVTPATVTNREMEIRN